MFSPIEHTADIAFEVSGTNLEEMFTSAFEAWQFSAYTLKANGLTETRHFLWQSENPEDLLVEFLSEMNFLFCSRKWIPVSINKIEISSGSPIELSLSIKGIEYSNNFINFKNEIKAVTYHLLEIKKDKTGCKTKLVFDI